MIKRHAIDSIITTENDKEWRAGFLENLKIIPIPEPDS